ncbi:hypothetical protein JW978_03795 [Candidatus Dojkabacteria bacterium]|nr:hypothetical protein [Candidatus Dojkabacteria bacterium]
MATSRKDKANDNPEIIKEKEKVEAKERPQDLQKSETSENKPQKEQEFDHHGFSCAFILIGAGVLLLLNTTGVISWDLWSNIWQLWPLVFVIWGIEMIIGKNRVLNCLFGCFTAFIFLFFVGLVAAATDDSFKNWVDNNIGINLSEISLIKKAEYTEEEFTIKDSDYEGIESRAVALDLGAGKYTLTDENSLNFLEAGLKYAEKFENPEWSVEENKGNLSIGFETRQKWIAFLANYENEYNFNFGRSDILTDLDVNLGAGEGEMDFERLDIDKLDLDIGAGEITIDLGSGAIPNEINIDIGAGEATLVLPEDVELDVEYDIGAGQMEIDGKKYSGDGQFTQDLENAFETLKIKVNVGAGQLLVKRG